MVANIIYNRTSKQKEQANIIVSRILYALPTWGDFLSVELKYE